MVSPRDLCERGVEISMTDLKTMHGSFNVSMADWLGDSHQATSSLFLSPEIKSMRSQSILFALAVLSLSVVTSPPEPEPRPRFYLGSGSWYRYPDDLVKELPFRDYLETMYDSISVSVFIRKQKGLKGSAAYDFKCRFKDSPHKDVTISIEGNERVGVAIEYCKALFNK
jgi:hypothetical protein